LGPLDQMPAVLLHALNSHPAVQTLSYDLLHSLAAFGYWMLQKEKVDSITPIPSTEQNISPKRPLKKKPTQKR
jgi:hypothetical protein